MAVCAAIVATVVLLPLCRQQLSRIRGAELLSTSACQGSGSIPAARLNRTGSSASAQSCATVAISASLVFLRRVQALKRSCDGQARLWEVTERVHDDGARRAHL